MGILRRALTFVLDGPLELRGSDYHHFYRIVVPTPRGSTEVDHLVVSRYGVFVIELKDRSGWILGSAADAQWTSVHFKQQHRFQNPLHQNYGHIKAVEELLGVSGDCVFGAVVFRGAFEFKTPVPAGVLEHRYKAWIAAHREVLLDADAVARILDVLETRTERGWFAGRRHARSVRARYASDVTCPKCGGALKTRTQRAGSNPGSQFLGCENYPRCKFTRNL